MPFLRGMIKVYSVLAVLAAAAATLIQVWALGGPPTYVGGLIFSIGQMGAVSELMKKQSRPFRLALASLLILGGIILQLFYVLS